MAERVPFLNTAYRAYHHRERPEEDAELTHVGPGTLCGKLSCGAFGSLLLPQRNCKSCRGVCASWARDCVAFHDKSGAVGLLELHCPARGTSLEFGLVSREGDSMLLSRLALRR